MQSSALHVTLTARLFPSKEVFKDLQKHQELWSERRIEDMEPLVQQIVDLQTTTLRDDDPSQMTPDDATDDPMLMDPSGSVLTLGIDLPTTSIKLIRDGQESADKALKRLSRTLADKLAPPPPPLKGKKQKPKKNRRDGTATITPSLLVDRQTINPKDFPTSAHLWTHLSSQATIHLQFPQLEELEVDVKSCPPTIVSIHSYQDLQARLFVGLPVLVHVHVHPPTSPAVIHWFVDGTLVTSAPSYAPTKADTGKKIQVLVAPRGFLEFAEAYEFSNVVEPVPPMPVLHDWRREWTRQRSLSEDDRTLRVLTYNLLADQYTREHMYAEAAVLDRKRRIPMLQHEILQYQADIVCLQEVDGKIFNEYYAPTMKLEGYNGFYTNKISGQQEGCATFWRSFVFDHVENISFSVHELTSQYESEEMHQFLQHVPRLDAKLRDLGQIAQFARLATPFPKYPTILLANTHLYYHPMGDHIRAIQAHAVGKKLHEMAATASSQGSDNNGVELLLCGDLNSGPKSGAVQLLQTQQLDPDHTETWQHVLDHPPPRTLTKRQKQQLEALGVEREKPTPPTLSLPRRLSAVYDPPPPFTHSIPGSSWTLDHILVSDGLRVKQTAPVVIRDSECPVLPTEGIPSDHISLVCDLEWDAEF